MAPTARVLTTSALLLVLCPLSAAQSTAERTFHKAYYLENSEHDFEHALALYHEVAESGASGELREKARLAAAGLREDMAAADFTQLMPPGTILYVEMNQPGGQLAQLLDQLGLLGDDGTVARGEFGISPRLLDSALGLKGAAAGITQINPMSGQPGGVVVLHPGRQDLVRGLIETILPAGGVQVDDIGGYPTWTVEKQAFVTMTSRLVVASQSKREIESVVARLHGEESESLADQPSLQHALAHTGQGLVSFCLNPKPLKPLMQLALASAGGSPEVAMAVAACDPHSLQAVAGHVGVDDDGLVVNIGLELEEGHRSLAFNFMRSQSLDRRTLELVPSGAAFFLATAFNPSSNLAALEHDSAEQPVVTAMDFGREIFGNLRDLAVFGMPSGDGPIPDVAAVMRVNDAQRSRAIWGLVLGLASQATQGEMEPERSEIAGAAVDTFTIEGMPIHLAARDGELVLSPSAAALERSLSSRASGSSVVTDPLFASSLAELPESSIVALAANVSRCAKMAAPHMNEYEREEMARVVHMLDSTVVSVGIEHSQTRLSVAARLSHVPDVSDLVAEALQQWKGGHAARGSRASVVRTDTASPSVAHVAAQVVSQPAKPKVKPVKPAKKGAYRVSLKDDLAATFEGLATVRPHDHEAALVAGQALVEALAEDANGLNALAWELLTEKRYDGDFPTLALRASQLSNELTDNGNWMYVDTLALAHFENGDVDKAIALEKRAVELAEGDSRREEAVAALARFEAAKKAAEERDR